MPERRTCLYVMFYSLKTSWREWYWDYFHCHYRKCRVGMKKPREDWWDSGGLVSKIMGVEETQKKLGEAEQTSWAALIVCIQVCWQDTQNSPERWRGVLSEIGTAAAFHQSPVPLQWQRCHTTGLSHRRRRPTRHDVTATWHIWKEMKLLWIFAL